VIVIIIREKQHV